jgi:hypothetical protein
MRRRWTVAIATGCVALAAYGLYSWIRNESSAPAAATRRHGKRSNNTTTLMSMSNSNPQENEYEEIDVNTHEHNDYVYIGAAADRESDLVELDASDSNSDTEEDESGSTSAWCSMLPFTLCDVGVADVINETLAFVQSIDHVTAAEKTRWATQAAQVIDTEWTKHNTIENDSTCNSTKLTVRICKGTASDLDIHLVWT